MEQLLDAAVQGRTHDFALGDPTPRTEFPRGTTLLTASGAAFTAIVLGQVANADACRSATRPAWAVPVRTNPLLLAAIVVELPILALLVYVPPLARLLGQAGPSAAGFAVALCAVPAVLAADATHKHIRRQRERDYRP